MKKYGNNIYQIPSHILGLSYYYIIGVLLSISTFLYDQRIVLYLLKQLNIFLLVIV